MSATVHGAEMPSAWVVRFAPLVPSGARVLDLACGRGRHALLFARERCVVDAVDKDEACQRALAGQPGIRFHLADVERGEWPFAERRFDAIVVTNYLYRPLLPVLRDALADGGLLIYETFAVGNERFGRPTNPDFLLRPRELLEAFAALRVIAFEDGYTDAPRPAMLQRLAARRAEPHSVLPVEDCALRDGRTLRPL